MAVLERENVSSAAAPASRKSGQARLPAARDGPGDGDADRGEPEQPGQRGETEDHRLDAAERAGEQRARRADRHDEPAVARAAGR